ncbi:hypothetical protein BRC81_10190 [Halobacteriales archaeon QS_1_68_20]|nr:MAG: hypothetical protein BRC81_10190 [Halobacteriales archaeon QS_1_68_20]
MAVDEGEDRPRANVMETLLSTIRERYVEEHGEEPPEEFMERARAKIVHGVATRDREEHRDIYDALADE